LLGTKQRVDFFRRSFGESFWDIIELKHPHKPLVSDVDGSILDFQETLTRRSTRHKITAI
jgi:hypothetical protein